MTDYLQELEFGLFPTPEADRADEILAMAQLAEGGLVAGFDRGVEQQVAGVGDCEPAIALDLLFQLSRAPAAIAQRKQCVGRGVADCHGFEHIERRRQADVFRDLVAVLLPEIVRRMQHEA